MRWFNSGTLSVAFYKANRLENPFYKLKKDLYQPGNKKSSCTYCTNNCGNCCLPAERFGFYFNGNQSGRRNCLKPTVQSQITGTDSWHFCSFNWHSNSSWPFRTGKYKKMGRVQSNADTGNQNYDCNLPACHCLFPCYR